MPAPVLPRPVPDGRRLPGMRVDLERLAAGRHGADLWRAVGSDPSAWALIPPGPFEDEAAFLVWLRERSRQPGAALYAVVDKSGSRRRAAGILFLLQIAPAMGTLEFGLVLGPALVRAAAGTEAVFLLLAHVLETMAYRRVEWRCGAAHAASRRAAARYGFTQEGILRQQLWLKGASVDTVVHAMLDRDWPAAARRLRTWLRVDNFDEAGRQIRPLAACEDGG